MCSALSPPCSSPVSASALLLLGAFWEGQGQQDPPWARVGAVAVPPARPKLPLQHQCPLPVTSAAREGHRGQSCSQLSPKLPHISRVLLAWSLPAVSGTLNEGSAH